MTFSRKKARISNGATEVKMVQTRCGSQACERIIARSIRKLIKLNNMLKKSGSVEDMKNVRKYSRLPPKTM